MEGWRDGGREADEDAGADFGRAEAAGARAGHARVELRNQTRAATIAVLFVPGPRVLAFDSAVFRPLLGAVPHRPLHSNRPDAFLFGFRPALRLV
eukprot:3785416-Rhodomonas_salina.1